MSLCVSLVEFFRGFLRQLCDSPIHPLSSPPNGLKSPSVGRKVYTGTFPVSVQNRPFRFSARPAVRLNRQTSLATWCIFACVYARRIYLAVLIEYRGILRPDEISRLTQLFALREESRILRKICLFLVGGGGRGNSKIAFTVGLDKQHAVRRHKRNTCCRQEHHRFRHLYIVTRLFVVARCLG